MRIAMQCFGCILGNDLNIVQQRMQDAADTAQKMRDENPNMKPVSKYSTQELAEMIAMGFDYEIAKRKGN